MKKAIYLISTLIIIWSCEKKTEHKDIVEVEDEGISIAVNESVISIDKDNTTNIKYSDNSETITISGIEGTVEENSVLVIDLDTAGVIRKVVSVETAHGETVCETEQATMEDVFGEANFKLSTAMIQPKTSLKSLKTNLQISKALTDEDGFIHPVEIIYHTRDGIRLKSAYKDINGQFGGNLYTYKDFSGKRLYKNSIVNFYISEGYAEFSPVFKFEFDYDKPKIDWDNLEVEKGKLNKFKFWSDETKFNFKTMLTCEVDKEVEVEEVKCLFKNVIKASFKFMVGTVPVYISIDCDIYGKYNLDFSSHIEVTTGFQATRYITMGVQFENGAWSKIIDYRKEDTFYPPQLLGSASLSQKLEIYPHFDVKLYKILGPNLDVIPFVYNENNVDISGNWDAHLDLGLDLRIGAEVEVLGKGLLSYTSNNINLYTKTVWEASSNNTEVDNLISNPLAENDLSNWTVTGNSGIEELSNGNKVFYTHNESSKSELTQLITLTENIDGKYALLKGDFFLEEIVGNAILAYPILTGITVNSLGKIHGSLGMNLDKDPLGNWITIYGISVVPDDTKYLQILMRQGLMIPKDDDGIRTGEKALYDNIELLIFNTQTEAEEYALANYTN